MSTRRATWERIAAWATWVTQVTIIGTGGAVRLTGSGLGCSEWPHCTPDDFFPVAEAGIHGFIEYGNRLMSGVVLAACVLLLVLSWAARRQRPTVFRLAVAIVALTLTQALIGAIVVWLHLRPDTVAIHFWVSILLVVLATWALYRVLRGPAPANPLPRGRSIVAWVASALLIVVVALGVLTTGSGPHAGDHGAARNGLDSELLQHLHAVPSYLLLATVVLGFVLALRARAARQITWYAIMLALLFVQIAVGIAQSNLGLPIALVGIHMVLSSLSVATMVVIVLTLREPASAISSSSDDEIPAAASV